MVALAARFTPAPPLSRTIVPVTIISDPAASCSANCGRRALAPGAPVTRTRGKTALRRRPATPVFLFASNGDSLIGSRLVGLEYLSVAEAVRSTQGGGAMHKYINRLALASSIVAAVIVGTAQAKGGDQNIVPKNNVLARALDIEMGRQVLRKGEQRLSSGALYAALAASGELGARADEGRCQGRQAPQGAPRVYPGMCEHLQGWRQREYPRESGLLAASAGRGRDRGQSAGLRQPDRRTERFARRFQQVRLRIHVRRRQDLGRHAAALLPIP